ncbi:MAG: hypothetical protein U1U88_000538 [Lawsonella clevelandensis]
MWWSSTRNAGLCWGEKDTTSVSVSEVTLADLEDLPDRIGKGELVIPVGEPQLALSYAESGTGIAILPETLAKVAGTFEGTRGRW